MAITEFDVVEIVGAAIEAERAGHKFYIQAADSTDDPKGKQMFTRLANDELAHLYWLMTVRQSLVKTGGFELKVEDIDKIKVPVTEVADYLFPAVGAAASGIENKSRDLAALQRGIETEQKATAFYAEAAEKTQDAGGKALFRKLADWEEQHLHLLNAEYDYLTNTGFYFGVAEFQLEGPDYLSWWRR
ncbi:MAG: ferritin family protein [Chloroflexi bacterium]|nr:ferritin family protein [Chloroflexota bacterium]